MSLHQQLPLPHTYWVEPQRLLAGAHPGAGQEVHALVKAGITVFIDLTEAGEWLAYDELLPRLSTDSGSEMSYLRSAIVDRDIPTVVQMIAILDHIDASLQRDKLVYVHCLAGIGRTGTVVGCYLARHGLTGTYAIQALAALRRHSSEAEFVSPETAAQRQFVQDWPQGQ
ncbi:MAG: dual specificity protein phosphatase family protein [Chloroflexota bacterium]